MSDSNGGTGGNGAGGMEARFRDAMACLQDDDVEQARVLFEDIVRDQRVVHQWLEQVNQPRLDERRGRHPYDRYQADHLVRQYVAPEPLIDCRGIRIACIAHGDVVTRAPHLSHR